MWLILLAKYIQLSVGCVYLPKFSHCQFAGQEILAGQCRRIVQALFLCGCKVGTNVSICSRLNHCTQCVTWPNVNYKYRIHNSSFQLQRSFKFGVSSVHKIFPCHYRIYEWCENIPTTFVDDTEVLSEHRKFRFWCHL